MLSFRMELSVAERIREDSGSFVVVVVVSCGVEAVEAAADGATAAVATSCSRDGADRIRLKVHRVVEDVVAVVVVEVDSRAALAEVGRWSRVPEQFIASLLACAMTDPTIATVKLRWLPGARLGAVGGRLVPKAAARRRRGPSVVVVDALERCPKRGCSLSRSLSRRDVVTRKHQTSVRVTLLGCPQCGRVPYKREVEGLA